jgi:hypothetical protein
MNLKNFTTEYTEFHGGKMIFVLKTPCFSVSSVVLFFLSFDIKEVQGCRRKG